MEQSLKSKLEDLGQKAKLASRKLKRLSTSEKNDILLAIKKSLLANKDKIIEENQIDMENSKKANMKEALLDRLYLDDKRIEDMLVSVDDMIKLDDPVGKIEDMHTMDNGLIIGKKSVPIGVLAIIYEARPNVSLDSSILAIKSSNCIILKGGKEAYHSNMAIAKAIRAGIKDAGFDENMVQIVDDISREATRELMKLRDYVDLLIPRGSKSLIQAVVREAEVPTLETGVGNCHLYVDEYADIDMALKIFENAKTQRIGVCNALESLLVHKDVTDDFYQGLNKLIEKYDLKVHACEKSLDKLKKASLASEEDFFMEYLNFEFSIKVVDNLDDAIDHIYKYSSGHSDAIVTEKIENAIKFTDEVDSSCVYVNASTRFTDGSQFGYGAELGISTQKLHARGPVGLRELTSYKYVVIGQGQVRK